MNSDRDEYFIYKNDPEVVSRLTKKYREIKRNGGTHIYLGMAPTLFNNLVRTWAFLYYVRDSYVPSHDFFMEQVHIMYTRR